MDTVVEKSSRIEMPVPPLSIGNIIGKGGVNRERIIHESGAKIYIKSNRVLIEGTTEQIDHAKLLIQRAVNNSIIVYEHPDKAIIGIRSNCDLDQNCYNVCFVPLKLAGNNSFKIYLQPTEDKIYDKNGPVFTDLNYGSKPESNICLFTSHRTQIIDLFCNEVLQTKKYVEMALKNNSGQKINPDIRSEIKVVSTIGHSIFYSSKSNKIDENSIVPLDKFVSYQVGAEFDIKSAFRTGIPKTSLEMIESAINTNGWTKIESREHVSAHLVDMIDSVRYTVSLLKNENQTFSIRKFRISKTKHCLFNILNVTTDSNKEPFDVRLRLYSGLVAAPSEEIINYIDLLKFDPIKNKVVAPFNDRFSIDIIRFKNKSRYEKQPYKISLNSVSDGFKSNYEIILLNSSLNNQLKSEDDVVTELNVAIDNLVDVTEDLIMT